MSTTFSNVGSYNTDQITFSGAPSRKKELFKETLDVLLEIHSLSSRLFDKLICDDMNYQRKPFDVPERKEG